ncbi:MAG: thioredoxin family protein [Thiohalomonadales bacterium]
MKIRLLLQFLILCFVFISNSYSAIPRDPYKYFFQETWGDFVEETTRAKSEGKKAIMIFFEMDECPFCHYMKTNVLNQPAVQEYYRKHFLLFSVDIEGDVEMVNFKGETVKQKDFSFKENRVRATPVIAFFDFDGKRIHRHTGKTSGVKEFMMMGEFVVSESYKTMSFSKYKRTQRHK